RRRRRRQRRLLGGGGVPAGGAQRLGQRPRRIAGGGGALGTTVATVDGGLGQARVGAADRRCQIAVAAPDHRLARLGARQLVEQHLQRRRLGGAEATGGD